MKRIMVIAVALLTLSLTAVSVSGGDAGDPLVSLSYLEGTFSGSLEDAVAIRLDAAGQEVRDAVQQTLDALTVNTLPSGQPAGGGNTTLKENDVLYGAAGLAFTLLEGDVQLNVSEGSVVDVTEGRETASGLLERGRRYIVAEDASAAFTVVSPAAVVSWEGRETLTPSGKPDYYAIAGALRSLDLFRGTGSGVGEGFDLSRAPTRGESLVMFIRILGEEAEALDCAYNHPFTDVPVWLDRYVGWAYQRGYANGVSETDFAPDRPISAAEYEEFMLRALGYSTAGADDYSTSLERALDCGALTRGEYEELTHIAFRRAHAAYISYYSLDIPISGTWQTLAQRMTGKGLLTEEQFAAARSLVETLRLT